MRSAFKLERYNPLAKRRAILESVVRGNGGVDWLPIAWVDYDDVGREEADAKAEAMLAGLLLRFAVLPTHDNERRTA